MNSNNIFGTYNLEITVLMVQVAKIEGVYWQPLQNISHF